MEHGQRLGEWTSAQTTTRLLASDHCPEMVETLQPAGTLSGHWQQLPSFPSPSLSPFPCVLYDGQTCLHQFSAKHSIGAFKKLMR